MDFFAEPKARYEKVRRKINYKPTEKEINRIRALNILLESSEEKKENMARNFEQIQKNDYEKAICGEDWYIAKKTDGTIEELVLPLNDPKAIEEMKHVKLELGSVTNSYDEPDI